MTTKPLPATILVIVGITGDLSRRYLLPAITELAAAGELASDFTVIGVSRRNVTVAEVLQGQKDGAFLTNHLEMIQIDLDTEADYRRLSDRLDKLAASFEGDVQRLFYLSVPPAVSSPIITHLGAVGLTKAPQNKLLIEKPFGTDLASAQALINHLRGHITKEQLYRIDHYLAKEMAQSIVPLRRNPIFARNWNGRAIERIEVLASEDITIEGRKEFYEETGALRDLVQSHLLQLLALVTMDLPADDDAESLRSARLAALESLRLYDEANVGAAVVRGQYDGYRRDVDHPKSTTETFVCLTLRSTNPDWQDVPLRITTGKALDQKLTEIRVWYRTDETAAVERLTLRIEPDPGVMLTIDVKVPGFDSDISRRALAFRYDRSDGLQASAYARVLLDAMRGDHRLFVTNEEVDACWQVLAPVQHHWQQRGGDDLIIYPPGTRPEAVGDKV